MIKSYPISIIFSMLILILVGGTTKAQELDKETRKLQERLQLLLQEVEEVKSLLGKQKTNVDEKLTSGLIVDVYSVRKKIPTDESWAGSKGLSPTISLDDIRGPLVGRITENITSGIFRADVISKYQQLSNYRTQPLLLHWKGYLEIKTSGEHVIELSAQHGRICCSQSQPIGFLIEFFINGDKKSRFGRTRFSGGGQPAETYLAEPITINFGAPGLVQVDLWIANFYVGEYIGDGENDTTLKVSLRLMNPGDQFLKPPDSNNWYYPTL